MKIKFESVLKVLSSKWFFISVFTIMASDIHANYSFPVMNIQSYVVKGNDLIQKYHIIWQTIKIIYIYASIACFAIIADFIYRNILYKFFFENFDVEKEKEINIPPYPFDEDKLQIIIGLKHNKQNLEKIKDPKWIIVDEKGMFQNFLITGTIGTGKTASAMYPFTKQAIFYKSYDPSLKPGMLILDVKGNFYKQAVKFAEEAGRLDDVIIIELEGKFKYNPMHKPNLRPLVLANRSKTVLSLFSPRGSSDGYWLDKAELLIAECIKLCRLYNKGYVTFSEINKLVNNKTYLDSVISEMLQIKENNELITEEEEEFDTCMDYFDNEYTNLSENTLSIIQSVVTQMTQFFYTDVIVKNTFSPPKEELNFYGFKDVIDNGKIVILKMNIAQYRNLAKTIAAYMKLDFQSEVMQRLVRNGANTERPVFMISDEYQEFVTATDAEFYSQSREPKCVNIVATQSYTSLINTLKDRDIVRTITQNLINKIWLRTDDMFTVEEAQKQTGKEDREKMSRSISENSGDVKKNRMLGSLVSDKASISESLNISTVKEFVFDEKLFTQKLDVFTGICFLSDGAKIIEPSIVHLQPYFEDYIKYGISKVKLNLSSKVHTSIIPDEGFIIKTNNSQSAKGCDSQSASNEQKRHAKQMEPSKKQTNIERGKRYVRTKKENQSKSFTNDDLI